MAATIKLKKSSVSGKEPVDSDLVHGELALNYADGILYYKDTNNTISNISGGGAVTDSAAPTGNSVRDGNFWWDATNGRLKVYYDDGDPAAASPITVSLTVNATHTNNAHYVFDSGWADRNGTRTYSYGTPESQDPTINIQAGDTVSINNGENANHPLFFVTQLHPITNNYDVTYSVDTPASYGGGTATTTYQFNTPGTYIYICGVHANMFGYINVLSVDTASKQWVDASPQGRGYTGSAGAIGYSENAPSNPAAGQIWYDTKSGKSYFYYVVSGNGAWVLFSDPTVVDGNAGFTGSRGATGARGTISPRGVFFKTPQVSEEQTVLYTKTELTVSEIRGIVRGGTSVEIDVKTAANRDDAGTSIGSGIISSTSAGDTITITSDTIPANYYVWVELTAVTGIVNESHINIIFSE